MSEPLTKHPFGSYMGNTHGACPTEEFGLKQHRGDSVILGEWLVT